MRDQFNHFFDEKSSSFAENLQMSYLDVFTNCTLRKTISFFINLLWHSLQFCFLKDCHLQEALNEVAEVSGIMTVGEDFLPAAVRTECERIIPDVDGIKPTDAADTFLFLKANYNQEQSTWQDFFYLFKVDIYMYCGTLTINDMKNIMNEFWLTTLLSRVQNLKLLLLKEKYIIMYPDILSSSSKLSILTFFYKYPYFEEIFKNTTLKEHFCGKMKPTIKFTADSGVCPLNMLFP